MKKLSVFNILMAVSLIGIEISLWQSSKAMPTPLFFWIIYSLPFYPVAFMALSNKCDKWFVAICFFGSLLMVVPFRYTMEFAIASHSGKQGASIGAGLLLILWLFLVFAFYIIMCSSKLIQHLVDSNKRQLLTKDDKIKEQLR
jgi:hypothetical protein